VTIAQTTASGNPPVRAKGSKVHITDSVLTGADGKTGTRPEPPYAAVYVTDGRLELTNSVLTGGNGMQFVSPAPALVASGAGMRIAGNSRCVLQAGTGSLSAAPAIHGTLSNLLIDPRVMLTPYFRAPKIDGTVSVQEENLLTNRANYALD
jgi:hypothetical protein